MLMQPMSEGTGSDILLFGCGGQRFVVAESERFVVAESERFVVAESENMGNDEAFPSLVQKKPD